MTGLIIFLKSVITTLSTFCIAWFFLICLIFHIFQLHRWVLLFFLVVIYFFLLVLRLPYIALSYLFRSSYIKFGIVVLAICCLFSDISKLFKQLNIIYFIKPCKFVYKVYNILICWPLNISNFPYAINSAWLISFANSDFNLLKRISAPLSLFKSCVFIAQ